MCTPTSVFPFSSCRMESASSRSRAVGGSMEQMRQLRQSRRGASSPPPGAPRSTVVSASPCGKSSNTSAGNSVLGTSNSCRMACVSASSEPTRPRTAVTQPMGIWLCSDQRTKLPATLHASANSCSRPSLCGVFPTFGRAPGPAPIAPCARRPRPLLPPPLPLPPPSFFFLPPFLSSSPSPKGVWLCGTKKSGMRASEGYRMNPPPCLALRSVPTSRPRRGDSRSTPTTRAHGRKLRCSHTRATSSSLSPQMGSSSSPSGTSSSSSCCCPPRWPRRLLPPRGSLGSLPSGRFHSLTGSSTYATSSSRMARPWRRAPCTSTSCGTPLSVMYASRRLLALKRMRPARTSPAARPAAILSSSQCGRKRRRGPAGRRCAASHARWSESRANEGGRSPCCPCAPCAACTASALCSAANSSGLSSGSSP
mmetsp:Transcript_6589/g.19882  ORF Transcript_6589/g.19882 Transcript_6589/m.19882 type:complete len:423 (+) Transcript_6589:1550-2818(+)